MYFKSISLELTSLKNRVRNFIEDKHWLTDGEWKESVIRSVLMRNLPENIRVGRGFILSSGETSSQIDVLLYSADSPVLFRDGDLVFISPEAVLGVIEVKTQLNKYKLFETISKLQKIGTILRDNEECFLSIFSYESGGIVSGDVLECLYSTTNSSCDIIDLICLGDSYFIRYWDYNPSSSSSINYHRWHFYELREMSYGYFIHNILQKVCPNHVDSRWFPNVSKEINIKETKQRKRFSYESIPVTEFSEGQRIGE
ncbi:hypothetical protein MSL71_50830 [Desulfoluna butyratoxydans]|uniref:DUF6602 domain-containing protein n=2 Tax=Desulfoluna butyratoxydans TaxID=231438 RepID=A0A4U8YZQ7_9BACT|nr:hypothetical protein MSL71_50830 [Desulfoluna butyratoxydans]